MLMLAAHEPYDDPRVDWAANTASELYDVTVYGLHNYTSRCSDEENAGRYRIRRIRRSLTVDARFLAHLIVAAGERVRKRLGVLGRPALLFALVALVPMEMLVRLCFVAALGVGYVLSAVKKPLSLFWPKITLGLARPLLVGPKTVPAQDQAPATSEADSGQSPAPALGSTPDYVPPSYWARVRMFQGTLLHVFGTAQVFWRAYCREQHRPAVIYCNDLDTLLPGTLMSMASGARLVYDSHEYWPYSNVEALPFHVWFFQRFERALIRRADAVITVSDPLARTLESAYGVREVHSIPNAEPWVGNLSTRTVAGELARLAAGRIGFLFQGSFAPQRGLEELVDAWANVDGRKAALFLRGPDNAWRQALATRAQRLGLLGTSVFVLQPVSVDELVTGATEADVGIIPYKPDSPAYRYACPNKLSQYMHAGIAILSNAIPYVAQQVESARCGLTYDSKDSSSIVTAVMRMAEHPTELADMKSAAREYGKTVFNWQVQSAKLPDLIRTPAVKAEEATATICCGMSMP
ncbi:MAG: hypothetical protein BroJett029_23230 [Alphaproteobacteria bacterium]|nr:MAG: hypothetical protein BroJett029_23230 [Alphaproteobacteria bacterium]